MSDSEIWIIILASAVVLAAVLGIFLAINAWLFRKERGGGTVKL